MFYPTFIREKEFLQKYFNTLIILREKYHWKINSGLWMLFIIIEFTYKYDTEIRVNFAAMWLVRRNAITNQSTSNNFLKKNEIVSFLIDCDKIIIFGEYVFVAIFNAGKQFCVPIRIITIFNGKSVLNHIGSSALIQFLYFKFH